MKNRISATLVLLASAAATAQPITLRPLLVSGDTLPDGSAFFSHLNRAVIDGDFVAAQISTTLGDAIIRINVVTGEIAMIATNATPSPTYPEFPLSTFTPPALAGDTVVFSAGSSRTGPSTTRREGVYKSSGGPLEIVADEIAFPSLLPRRVSTDGTSVLFRRPGAGNPIAITPINGGSIDPFAFQGTPAPDGGILFDVWEGFTRNGGGGLSALISGISPTYRAVYRFTPPSNALTTIAKSGDPMHGELGRTYSALFIHDAESDAVLFSGRDNGFPLNHEVLCLDDSTGTHVIANGDTPMPGVPGRTFDTFSGSTDGNDVLFFGNSQPDGPSPIYGAYWVRDGVTYPVIDSLDTIDGLNVRDIGFLDQAIDGDRAVLALGLGNFQKFGIYLAEFETPCLADVNNDGQATPADFGAWVAAFNAMSTACDQNGDGACTPADFGAWITNFNSGC